MRNEYWPGSSLAAGKLKLPCASLTTVIVTVEPAFLALTSTPSIGPSSPEVTCPVRAAGVCARAGSRPAPASAKARPTDISILFMRIVPSRMRCCAGATHRLFVARAFHPLSLRNSIRPASLFACRVWRSSDHLPGCEQLVRSAMQRFETGLGHADQLAELHAGFPILGDGV